MSSSSSLCSSSFPFQSSEFVSIALFQISKLRWCEMMIKLEQSCSRIELVDEIISQVEDMDGP